MVFSVINKESKSRRKLTDLLLSVYPGCVIYELEEPKDVLSCLLEHTLDAVFWEISDEDSQDLHYLNKIRELDQGTLIFICAEDDDLLEDAMWNGASMYFVKPMLPDQLVAAITAKEKV